MTSKNFFKFHFPFLLWLAVIFVQSSFPAIELPKVEFFSPDKLAHMGVYGLLAALCYISLIHQTNFKYLHDNAILFTLLICSLYGASDELHQYFVPMRSCEFYDWAADAAGTVIMIVLIKFYLTKRYFLFGKAAV